MTTAPEKSLLHYHDSRFDVMRDRAVEFVRDDLNLPYARSLGKLAIIHEEDMKRLGNPHGGHWGEYSYLNAESIVAAHPDVDHPTGAAHRLVSQTVHELVHSATVGPHAMMNEHSFWREGIAGLGEVLYLADLERRGKRDKVADFILQHGGVDVWVPGAFRYYENNATDGTANTSQGLVAASAFAVAQRASSETARDVLHASSRSEARVYTRMKKVFDDLKPGLTHEIEQYPETTSGIIQATAMVHEEGRRRGILPRR